MEENVGVLVPSESQEVIQVNYQDACACLLRANALLRQYSGTPPARKLQPLVQELEEHLDKKCYTARKVAAAVVLCSKEVDLYHQIVHTMVDFDRYRRNRNSQPQPSIATSVHVDA